MQIYIIEIYIKAMMVLSRIGFSAREKGSPAVSSFRFRSYFEIPAGAASLKPGNDLTR